MSGKSKVSRRAAVAGPANAAAVGTAAPLLIATRRAIASKDARQVRTLVAAALAPGAAAPSDLQAVGRLLAEASFLESALACLRHAVARQPERIELRFDLIRMALAGGHPRFAIRQLHTLLARHPRHAPSLVLLGDLALRQGAFTQAAAHYRQALTIAPRLLAARVNLGNALLESDQPAAAVEQLTRALKQAPGEPSLLNSLGLACQRLGRFEAALQHYRAAIARDPRYAVAHNNLATLYKDTGQLEAARDAYRAALALAPDPDTFTNLALCEERAGALPAAAQAARQALLRRPGDARARALLAKLDGRQGKRPAAIRAYRQLLEEMQGSDERATRLTAAQAAADLGILLEKDGCFDEAFARFAQAKTLIQGSDPYWRDYEALFLARVRQVRGLLEAAGRRRDALAAQKSAPPASDSDDPAPIFLVGFPRSGTTLLDLCIDAHPETRTIEERPLIGRLAAKLPERPGERLAWLAEATPETIRDLRRGYRELAKAAAMPGPGRRIVDKMPFNLVDLWLIGRLFPESPVVLSLRDPRDVIVSCFSRLFRPAPGLTSLPDLETIVRLYGEVMGLVASYETVFGLCPYRLRYEALTADAEGTLRPLLAHLGLPWHDAVLDHQAAGKRRFLTTPSYDQVSRPLNRAAVGRWRPYRAQLAPYLPALAPFVAAFGYAEDEQEAPPAPARATGS